MHRLSQIMGRRQKLRSGLIGECELMGALLKLAFKRFNGPGFYHHTSARRSGSWTQVCPSKTPSHRSRCGLIDCRSDEPKSSLSEVSANPINTLMFLRAHAPIALLVRG